jgi:hypothetical protein
MFSRVFHGNVVHAARVELALEALELYAATTAAS